MSYGVVKISNSILWDNWTLTGPGTPSSGQESDQLSPLVATTTIHHSVIEGWTGQYAGPKNSGQDPVFVDAAGADGVPGTEDDDLRLHASSPFIDYGNNARVLRDYLDLDHDGVTIEPTPLDIAGRERFFDVLTSADRGVGPGPLSDVGAFEHFGDVCQEDLGFANPGTLRPTVCGDSLVSAQSIATLLITGASRGHPILMFVGGTSQPVMFQGFTLIPGPPSVVLRLVAGGHGDVVLAVFGKATPPASFYLQGAVSTGVSNAVKLTIGL